MKQRMALLTVVCAVLIAVYWRYTAGGMPPSAQAQSSPPAALAERDAENPLTTAVAVDATKPPLPGSAEAELMHETLSLANETPAPLSQADLQRQAEMEKLGYLIPPEYHGYELNYLKALAARGDVYAKVHLAERYYFEIKADPHHPYYDRKLNYLEAAKTSLKDAIAHGHAHSTAILAEIHLMEKQPVEAAAWSLLSEQAGDKMSRDWFKRTDVYAQLTAEQNQQVRALAQQYAESLRQQAHKLDKDSLFDAVL